MVDPREPLEPLIAPPARFTSGTAFPRREVSQDLDGVKAHNGHLERLGERLGLTGQDLLAYALVLGRELAQASR